MKKLLGLLFLFSVGLIDAQVEKFHRVLITGDNELVQTLQKLDVDIDHAHFQGNSVIAEIADHEVDILKKQSIDYKILIYDLSTYYEQRNLHDQYLRSAAITDCNAPPVKVPSHFRLGKMGGYFTLTEMENILDTMALLYQNLITIKQAISTVQSVEGRNIWYVKISDSPNIDENEPEVLYTSLHHAREAASLSQLIFYMWYLLENYATDPDVKATLDNTELFFVPCVNPDGYVFNEITFPNGGGMWRKNRRINFDNTYGVDLNRNYGYNWGFDNLGSSPSPQSQTYRGAGPFSEPETQAMQIFCNSRQFKNALNAHTFSNVLIYPWGFIPFPTPDSLIFKEWGKLLTKDSKFLYGTCDETLGYLTNGSSDDWMYGEQSSKPKIFSMTPEAGTYLDGFWPLSSRIVDICKTTFSQNYNLARLAGNCAVAKENNDKFITGNGYVKYNLRRIGLTNGNYTVGVNPVGSNLTFASPKIYSNLAFAQVITDSISFTIAGAAPAQRIRYDLFVNTGNGILHDTITKIYGTPITVFYDDCSSANNFNSNGTWGVDQTKFNSPPGSITDSPVGTYASNDHTDITTAGTMSLKNALYAHLQYYTTFELEKTFDYSQILISIDNGLSFQPLCGIYETAPASNGASFPLYDGKEEEWVKEDIDLSAYLGQDIKLRFTLDADLFEEKEGFSFDDFFVRTIGTNVNTTAVHESFVESVLVIPNPSSGLFRIKNPGSEVLKYTVNNSIGQLILDKRSGDDAETLDLQEYPAGIYILRVQGASGFVIKKLILEK